MSFLVDTNVFSEATRRQPDRAVEAWLARHEPELYVSALTIGEIRYGIDRLPRGKRRDGLHAWLTRTCDILEGRILSVNTSVCHTWGQLRARWEAAGISLSTIDGLLAATASRHGLVVATRNLKHFEHSGVATVDPFQPEDAD